MLALVFTDLPGVSVLRLFRAFRVFRLFKRIKSLRVIIEGVFASLPGVFNAFIVLLILMGIVAHHFTPFPALDKTNPTRYLFLCADGVADGARYLEHHGRAVLRKR